ncbi:ParB/RepB/Spo0J family partition protein [Legionella pneumophila serogroup 1]|uniref:ParB/RepB/Spo0J family partition protein n=1 Tax=Legionella pneumophila TaxID=446 RepID=UPI00077712E5|nr:ParB/RepB/Spo0J family partition protein [Legionella pneumophila]HAT8623635.1 ParB/RepB/Spo0J family partition protein [Legionella pneumophila]HAU1410287.1 ParB/RepB/Spo0J family partition protein [Legionella pneumophila]HCC3170267.1 ParB/RepB/Spo0J family partition protein [Legionella pneumophila]HCC3179497.1 ParB/RepB/Spo0J family partition protein [Legionella pneumophila]HCC3185447.1 ParB/RepB/Spo0J family partition protein [Legionella pneumophila]
MKKRQQQEAASLAFRRMEVDDWEVIATEQYEENRRLISKIEALESVSSEENRFVVIDPQVCKNWMYSDRNDFEMGDIDGLAEDIKANGLLQPVIVRPVRDSLDYQYEVIAGERRWRACKIAGVSLKAIVIEKEDTECLVIQTSENKKKQLSPYSQARVYARLMKDLNISQNELARKLGIPKSSFGELLSFNKVPEAVWASVMDMSRVKVKTAAYIASCCDKGEEYALLFIKLASKIREGIGADNLEKLVNKHFLNLRANRNSSSTYKDEKGVFLFRLTSEGRISFSKAILKQVDLKDIAEHLMTFFKKV